MLHSKQRQSGKMGKTGRASFKHSADSPCPSGQFPQGDRLGTVYRCRHPDPGRGGPSNRISSLGPACPDESIHAAIDRPELIHEAAQKFGSQCVVVAIDAKRRPDGGWNIYKHGGRLDTGIDALTWAKKVEELGAGEILLTSMDCDGTKAGYDIELTRAVADAVSIPVIASGGAGTLEHFYDALTEGGADAALAASLFHYKELEIREVKDYLAEKGISVRR